MLLLVQQVLLDTNTIIGLRANNYYIEFIHDSYTTLVRCDTTSEVLDTINFIWNKI